MARGRINGKELSLLSDMESNRWVKEVGEGEGGVPLCLFSDRGEGRGDLDSPLQFDSLTGK